MLLQEKMEKIKCECPLVKDLIEFSLYYLVPDVKYNIIINVRFMRLGLGVQGSIFSLDKYNFIIDVKEYLETEVKLKTIAHEMIHVQQYAHERLSHKQGITSWKETRNSEPVYLKDVPYCKRPWEVEAYNRTKEVISAYGLSNIGLLT